VTDEKMKLEERSFI